MEQNQLFEQLASQYAGNPQMQAMLSLMQKSKAAESGEEGSGESELALCKAKLSRAAAKIRRLKEEVEELNQAMTDMEHFSEDMASALGACTFCWGEDPDCRACRGRGKPGAFDPDPALFERLVLPAWRRRQASQQ